jgi:hypothetical protein
VLVEGESTSDAVLLRAVTAVVDAKLSADYKAAELWDLFAATDFSIDYADSESSVSGAFTHERTVPLPDALIEQVIDDDR